VTLRAQGHVDEFEFEEGVDVGDIREVFIRHDDSALFGSDDWFLESVTIQHHVAGKAWKFTCKDWLRKTKDLKPEKLLSDAVAVDMSGKELVSPKINENIRGVGSIVASASAVANSYNDSGAIRDGPSASSASALHLQVSRTFMRASASPRIPILDFPQSNSCSCIDSS
jgi:hypothetical protein